MDDRQNATYQVSSSPTFWNSFGLGERQMNFLAHVGFGFLGLSYLTKKMVHLRLCLCLANVWLVAWGVVALSGDAAWAAAGWNTLFCLINARRFYQAIQASSNDRRGRKTATASLPGREQATHITPTTPIKKDASDSGVDSSIRISMSASKGRREDWSSPARKVISARSWHGGTAFLAAASEMASPILVSPVPSPPGSFEARSTTARCEIPGDVDGARDDATCTEDSTVHRCSAALALNIEMHGLRAFGCSSPERLEV